MENRNMENRTSAFQDERPNEAALLDRCIKVLREVQEDLACDGQVSEKTQYQIAAILIQS